MVRFSTKDPAPRLDWYPIDRYSKTEGECLAAFELLLVSGLGTRVGGALMMLTTPIRMREEICRLNLPKPLLLPDTSLYPVGSVLSYRRPGLR